MDAVALAGICAVLKQVQSQGIKPISTDIASKASPEVEKGNNLFIKGDFKGAAAAYDNAAEADQESPVPWLNGALTSKELGKLGLAKLAVNTAFHMGDKSIRGKVISADIDMARKQFEPSKSKFGQALFENPNEEFALAGYAQWNMKQAHLREGERFMWQGYRQGAPVLMDSKFHTENSFVTSGGPSDGSVSAVGQILGSDVSTSYNAGFTAQTVAGSALQELAKIDFAFDTPFGIIAGNHRDLKSDRPGIGAQTLVLPSTPGSRLDFRHTMIGLQNRLGNFTFHANYRQEFSAVRSVAFGNMNTDNRMHQYILETRYDSGQWMGGGGYSKVSKNSVPVPGIEPLEMIFPQGTTNMYNGYLVNRQDLNKNMKLTMGGIYTSAQGVNQGGVMGQLAIRTIGNRYIKIGVKPGINRVQTNLGPINDMAGSLESNGLDRLYGSALEFNRDIAIPSLNSRLTNAFFSAPLAGSLMFSAFRNSFTNQNFIGTDPQTSSQLNTTLVRQGQVTGVTLENTMNLGSSMNMRLSATAQSSTGTYAGLVRSLANGVPEVVKFTEMPNIPRVEATAAFDWSTPSSTFALSAHYIGARSVMNHAYYNAALPDGSYVTRANPGTSIDAHFSFSLPANGSFEVTLLNLGNTCFFPGYRSSRQVMIGYTSRQ